MSVHALLADLYIPSIYCTDLTTCIIEGTTSTSGCHVFDSNPAAEVAGKARSSSRSNSNSTYTRQKASFCERCKWPFYQPLFQPVSPISSQKTLEWQTLPPPPPPPPQRHPKLYQTTGKPKASKSSPPPNSTATPPKPPA